MDKINGKALREMLLSGCNNLNARKKEVDALNVFPVPDGDTGTNMSLTFTNGIAEVEKSGSEQFNIVAKTLSRGLLMGARGNSGVILSQIFRGFAQAVADKEELDAMGFANAFLNGAKLAYKAVMRPVEGTILTVIREASEYGVFFVEQNPNCTIEEFFDLLCKEAKASLDRTPELLPILKEARVVDSGATGLLVIFEGFYSYLIGNPILSDASTVKNASSIKGGYRVEFILNLSDHGKHLFNEEKVRNSLGKIGDEITMIQDGDTIKVRLVTLAPGDALSIGQRYGEFAEVQIDNFAFALKPSILETTTEKVNEFGVISVCAGKGLEDLFKKYRADYVIAGGQTMNPSTQDFVDAIAKVNAKNIFILPNNSNIILAAQQASTIVEGKNVHVLTTKSIPQGLAACLVFNPEATLEDNLETMNQAIKATKSGSITYAIKDTVIDGKEIHAGDFMSIYEKDIVATSQDKVQAVHDLLDAMVDDDSGIITLIYGDDIDDVLATKLSEELTEKFDLDVELHKGNQPVYSFIVGVE